MNRPGFSRHFAALNLKVKGGVYEQQAIHVRVQDRSGQTDQRARPQRGRCIGASGGEHPQPVRLAQALQLEPPRSALNRAVSQEEVRRLKAALRRVTEERDILKKAAA